MFISVIFCVIIKVKVKGGLTLKKKKKKITLALSSILLSVSLVGCSNGDGLNRSAKDGKENEVEKAL